MLIRKECVVLSSLSLWICSAFLSLIVASRRVGVQMTVVSQIRDDNPKTPDVLKASEREFAWFVWCLPALYGLSNSILSSSAAKCLGHVNVMSCDANSPEKKVQNKYFAWRPLVLSTECHERCLFWMALFVNNTWGSEAKHGLWLYMYIQCGKCASVYGIISIK